MPSHVAARRLEILAAAQADPAAFLRLDPARLRFSLGTSLADVSVPVELHPDARAIVGGAAAQLALLLATHHRRLLPADEVDRLLLREECARLPPAPPTLEPGPGGPDLRAAARLAATAHPALPGGLVGAWLGTGGKGRSLVGLWIELLRRALEEMGGARGEETPIIVTAGLAAGLAAAEAEVRQVLPAGPLSRHLQTAAMTGLWIAARTGLDRAFRAAGRAESDPLRLRTEALLSPALLLPGRGSAGAGGSAIYGCELTAGVPGLEELVARAAGRGPPPALAAEIGALLAADGALAGRAELAVALGHLRAGIAAAVVRAEGQGQVDRVAPLRELLATPGLLAAGVADEGPRQVLLRQLAAAAPAGEAGALLERTLRALRDWRPREPAAVFGLSRTAARAEYADAVAGLAADLALERLSAACRRALSFRTGREAEGGADAEWEAGRLYRLSAAPGPILRAAVERPVAHLFADVKDFTRRTALVGQAAMADLLRREFYLPLLAAAKEQFAGMSHLADRGGVQVNNLLGDAISFSGRIEGMVQLAQGIRRAFEAYAARLRREVDAEVVRRQLAGIDRQHAAAVAAAAAARADALAAAEREPPGSPARRALEALGARLAEEEARVAEERERALARARGEVLEAGVFISHGAAPLVVVIEDEVFGANRVAIADKINESARGTARAPSARLRADARLAAERVARRSPQLTHAWSVFIDQPLALPVPPAAEEQALGLARAGDLAGAMRALAAPVREGLEAALREEGERSGDIYNSGVALSEEALSAFLAEVDGQRVVRRVELAPEEIPAAARAFFFYGADPTSLVVAFHPDGRVAELFRRVGRAGFKGLGGVTVWELCAEGGGPAALVSALRERWFDPG